MKNRQTTIIDIAKALNISKSTVSRALTDHPNIKAETKKAVLELASEMDYQRNMLSVSLVNKKNQYHWDHCTGICQLLFFKGNYRCPGSCGNGWL